MRFIHIRGLLIHYASSLSERGPLESLKSQVIVWTPLSMAEIAVSTSFLKLPHELLMKIFNLLADSKDALCLALVHSIFRGVYPLTKWSSLLVDVRSLRCRLYRDLKDPESERLYYCRMCTSGRVPCGKHGAEAIVSIRKGRAYRRMKSQAHDPPLLERVRRMATDNHTYCCMSRG